MPCRKPLYMVLLLTTLHLIFGCTSDDDRRIKLANTSSESTSNIQTASSVLDVTPDEQHFVVIMTFENQTADTSLDWLSRGLAEMLRSRLSQSASINVSDVGLLGKLGTGHASLEASYEAARRADIESIVTGSLDRDAQGIRIYAAVHDVQTKRIVKKEYVTGQSLDQIFSMVDKLAERLSNTLRQGRAADEPTSKIAMTQSVDAFRCYSKALESLDRYAYDEALQCLQKALAIDSTFAKAQLLLAKIKFRVGDPDGASRALKIASTHKDRLSESDLLILRLYNAKLGGNLSELLTVIEEFLHFEPDDIDARVQVAELHKMFRNYNRAIAEYELILEVDPTHKIAHNHLAYIYANRGDFSTALQYLDEYRRIAPEEPNPHDSKGEILKMAGRLDEAVKEFGTALAKNPNFVSSVAHLLEIYSELGNYSKTIGYANRRIEIAASPQDRAGAYTRKAMAQWRFGYHQEAKASIAQARKAAPRYVYPVIIGGEMYQAIGDAKGARDLYQSYADEFPNLPHEELNIYETDGLALFCMEATLPNSQLISIVDQLRHRDATELEKLQYHMLLGILYLRDNQPDKAIEHCVQMRDEFYDLLVQLPNEGRSHSWKYSIEAVELEPKQSETDLSFVDGLYRAAKEAGRKDIEVLAQFLYAQYDSKYGRRDRLAARYRAVGTPLEEKWQVIGPFENRSGFDRPFPPENEVVLTASYQAGGRSATWRPAVDGMHDGYVNLRKIIPPSSWAVGYGVVYVNSPEKRTVQLRVGSDEACKLWLNDKPVWQSYRNGEAPLDNDIISVVLHPGNNKLLIKVTNSVGDWGFYLRVTDDNGDGYSDIEFRSANEIREPIAARPGFSAGE